MFTYTFYFLIIIFDLMNTIQTSEPNQNTIEKKNITIAFILPQDFIRFRKLQTCITNQIARINKGNWSFSKHFYIDSYTFAINRNFNDIIETICTLLNTQSNTAIYINYNDYSNIEALNSRLFLKLASFINIPVMTHMPNAYATNTPRKTELQLVPTLYHQAEAIMSLLNRYEWYKYSLIVTDLSGSADLVSAAEELQNSNIFNKTFQILSVVRLKFKKDRMNLTEIKKQFQTLSLETRVILLHCDIDETSMIFEAASVLGLTTHEYVWIFTRSVITSHLYGSFKYKNYPIGSFSLWSNTSADNLCDTTISNTIKIWAHALDIYVNAISKERLYTVLPHTKCWNSSISSINDIKYHYGKNFHNYLIKSSIKEKDKSQIKFDQKGVLDMVEFKILNLNQKHEWKQIGVWKDKSLTMEDIVWPGQMHKPPSGKPTKFHLKIVTLEEQPFVIYKDPMFDGTCPRRSVRVRIASETTRNLNMSNPNHFQCASGFYVDLIIELSESLEFTYEIYEVEDKKWGAVNKLGEWNGIIKDLMDNKADLAMTSVKITTARVDNIDFSVPFFETGIAIIVSLRPGSVSTTAFLKPYDYLIWIMLLLITVHSVALAVFLLQWLYNKMIGKSKNTFAFRYLNKDDDPFKYALIKYEDDSYFTFGRSLWLVWVVLFRAATKAQQPTSFSSKFIVMIWACMCLVFTASYTANLAAFMIIQEEYPDLKSVLDSRLTNPYAYKPTYRFGTVKSGSTAEIIEKTQPRMYEYMKNFMKDNVSEGIQDVKEKKLDAFLYDALILEYRAGLDVDCKLRVVGSWYSMTGYGIALTKRSKYKEMIDRKIVEYIYSGQMERSQRFWFTGSCSKQKEDKNTDGLGFLQISSVFILLVSGVILGFSIYLMDIIWIRYFNDNKNKETFYDNRKYKRQKRLENTVRKIEMELEALNSFGCVKKSEVIKEFDYQERKAYENTDSKTSTSNEPETSLSSYQQDLVVYSSPEKSPGCYFGYIEPKPSKSQLDAKNSVILGTNLNEMIDVNFIANDINHSSHGQYTKTHNQPINSSFKVNTMTNSTALDMSGFNKKRLELETSI